MSPEWFSLWWPAFLVTVLGETPVVALFVRDRVGIVSALVLGVALQAVTHPLFWLAWEHEAAFLYAHYDAAVLAFEAVIYLVEAALTWLAIRGRWCWRDVGLALMCSTVANTVSLMIGILTE